MNKGVNSPTEGIRLRPAVQADAGAIGAVFDAAVRDSWTYLGDLAASPMFTPQDWEQLVSDHQPPNALLVAVDDTDGVVGYAAAHLEDGEMFLLFVHPAHAWRGIGRALLDAAHDAARGRVHRGISVRARAERAGARRLRGGWVPAGWLRPGSRGTRTRELRLVKQLEA